jgi:hypothetical protein
MLRIFLGRQELIEAARIDGLSVLGTLVRISSPSLPAIGVATMFSFLAAWNEFLIALTVTRTPKRPDNAGWHLDPDHAVPDVLGSDDRRRRHCFNQCSRHGSENRAPLLLWKSGGGDRRENDALKLN